MAKCVRCGQRKGKRRCPALDGDICTLCCGTERGESIDCPETCAYWTGKHDTRTRGGDSPFHRLMDKLVPYAQRHQRLVDEAAGVFLGEGEDEDELMDWARPLYDAYLLYGYFGDDGVRLVDHFALEQEKRLPADEREALACLLHCHFSLFEIQEVHRDEGLDVVDLITNEHLYVSERAATNQFVRYDCFAGFVGPLGDTFVMTGGAAMVPRVHKDPVLAALRAELAMLRNDYPDADQAALSREAAPMVHDMMLEVIGNRRPPRTQTMDGEDVVFCEAVYDVADEQGVRARLEAHDDFEAEGEAFTWVDRRGRPQLGDGPLLLGRVVLGPDRLRLEVQSRERLERGKRLLTSLLEGAASHRLDTVKDLEVAIAEHKERGELHREADALPPEVAAQVLSEFMSQHMRRWMDEPVPALGDKTPREAVATPSGREQVVDLVKGQENLARRMQGNPDLDLSWVLRELGI